ncbi:hypothetical protein [Mesorhizobium sp. B2-4-14]|uniref:hypothetical protein n=1 Tax=Mesorhizobium sp. B2-4-14 TaxID=2589935 RepID=UPI0015E3A366|nr:hypothetical protein [Mesorhizobium sp. B2-4-14]
MAERLVAGHDASGDLDLDCEPKQKMIAQDMVTIRLAPPFHAVIVCLPAYIGR